jgi:hypothetical protein
MKMQKQVRFRERVNGYHYIYSDESSSSFKIMNNNNNNNNNNKDERIIETTRRQIQTYGCCETNKNRVVKDNVICRTASSNEQRHYYRRCISAPEQLHQKQQFLKHDDDPRDFSAVPPLLLNRWDEFVSPSASSSSSSPSQKQIRKLPLPLSSNTTTTTTTATITATTASTPSAKLSEGLRQLLLVELLVREDNSTTTTNNNNNNIIYPTKPVRNEKSAESINTTIIPIIHVAANNDPHHHRHRHRRRSRSRPHDTPPVIPVRKPFLASKSKSKSTITGMALFDSTVLHNKNKNNHKRKR